MQTIHKVSPGEHLASIAETYGFPSIDPIWNDPANAELKELRKTPHVLKPGDKLTIPEKELRTESRATDKHHKFVLNSTQLLLHVVLQDVAAKPMDNAECTLDLGDKKEKITTDKDGKIERSIPASTHDGRLIVSDKQGDLIPVPFGVGDLDPIDTPTGQAARLYNLGYHPGPLTDPAEDPAKKLLKAAIEEFQCENGLTVDGDCGPKSQEKLKSVHGC